MIEDVQVRQDIHVANVIYDEKAVLASWSWRRGSGMKQYRSREAEGEGVGKESRNGIYGQLARTRVLG